MADTYTTVLGITKPEQGGYFNAWHTPANLVFEMLADAIAGETALALTADTSITVTDGADDSGRAYVLRVSSSDAHDRTITVPAALKTYVLVNDSDKRVKIKPVAGTATDVMPATEAVIRVTASKAVRVATSGWGLFTNATTTSGTTATITLTTLGQHFSDLRLLFKDVNLGGGTMQVQLRTDAASGGTAQNLVSAVGAVMGDLTVQSYRLDYGGWSSRTQASASSPTNVGSTGGGNTADGVYRVTGGIGSIVISNSGASFSAGSIDCYLR